MRSFLSERLELENGFSKSFKNGMETPEGFYGAQVFVRAHVCRLLYIPGHTTCNMKCQAQANTYNSWSR
jgi:hypothetical protein